MRLLSAVVIIALFVFFAGTSFTWWSPNATGIGWAWLVAAILIALDVFWPGGIGHDAYVARRRTTTTTTTEV